MSSHQGLQRRWIPRSPRRQSHRWEVWKHTYRETDDEPGLKKWWHVPTVKFKNSACLWLLADGLHKNIMTNRMTENKNLQKASSTHSSIQSFQIQKHVRLSLQCQNQIWFSHYWQIVLTDWQSANQNFFAVQPIKMMEAEEERDRLEM